MGSIFFPIVTGLAFCSFGWESFPPGPIAPPIATFTLAIGVAPDGRSAAQPGQHVSDGAPVVDDAWIDAQVDAAEALFASSGVHFVRGAARPLDARFAALETRKDRDALGAELVASSINVFIVGSLRDVDEPPRLRMGVHWRPASNVAQHYVIVAASARPSTLAHELGHFFGNPHSPVEDNIMSYERTGGPVSFDAAQVRTIKAFARTFLATKELAAAKGP